MAKSICQHIWEIVMAQLSDQLAQAALPTPEIGRSITTNGIVTNYHDQGGGSPILLIHGSGPGVSAWANWRLTLPLLAAHGRVIAPDMAGFGYTEAPPGVMPNIDLWVGQVLGLLDALSLPTVSVVGNSFGGAIALHLATRHPERVERLVLMGAVGVEFSITPGLEKVWGYQPSVEAMRDLIRLFAFDQSIVTDDLVGLRYRASVRADVQERFSKLFPPPRQSGISALALDEATLRRLPHDVLLIHGREDQVIPLEASETMQSLIPNARLQVFERCGHWVQIEHPNEFGHALTEFLFPPAVKEKAIDVNDIVGRWTIVAWQQEFDDGRTTYPMGQDLGGFITYDAAGNVAVLIARRGREAFSTGGQWNAADTEKARAYDGMMSYCGTYEVQGEEILHRVEFSLFPNWEGGVQRRRAMLKDGDLHLTARIETGTPQARTASLIWRRSEST